MGDEGEPGGKADGKEKRGNRKKAPTGFYTAQQAYTRLGMPKQTFYRHVEKGDIRRIVPSLASEGYYDKKEIDDLAIETELAVEDILLEHKSAVTLEARVVQPQDVAGIYAVLHDIGWQTATPEQRLGWYEKNSLIDYVVVRNDQVLGYITAVPYTPDALEAMMSGRKRAWHMTPDDIYAYQAGIHYTLYVGAAVRQELPNHTHIAFRLIAGFMDFMKQLVQQGIIIDRLYAISDQPDGQRLCRNLGFVEEPGQEHDHYPRYMPDLTTSDSHFAEQYRAVVQKGVRHHTIRKRTGE